MDDGVVTVLHCHFLSEVKTETISEFIVAFKKGFGPAIWKVDSSDVRKFVFQLTVRKTIDIQVLHGNVFTGFMKNVLFSCPPWKFFHSSFCLSLHLTNYPRKQLTVMVGQIYMYTFCHIWKLISCTVKYGKVHSYNRYVTKSHISIFFDPYVFLFLEN